MAFEHAPTDIGNKADIPVVIPASNVAAPLNGRNRPRGRGQGRSTCARVLAAISSYMINATDRSHYDALMTTM